MVGFDNTTPTSGFGAALLVSGLTLTPKTFNGTVAVTSRFQVAGTFSLSDPAPAWATSGSDGKTWASAGFAAGQVVVIPGVGGDRTVTGFGNSGMDLLVSGGTLSAGSYTGIVGVVRVGGNSITVTGTTPT